MTDKPASKPRHVLFLDGDCLLCQKSVALIHRIDRHASLYFATLQGETAKSLPDSWKILIDKNNHATGAAVLTEAWQSEYQVHWRGPDAILRSLYLAGGVFAIFWPLSWLPKWIKSPIYQLIARHRHRLPFSNSYPFPTEELKARFLP